MVAFARNDPNDVTTGASDITQVDRVAVGQYDNPVTFSCPNPPCVYSGRVCPQLVAENFMGEKGVRVTDWECPEGRSGNEGAETFSETNGGITTGWHQTRNEVNFSPCLEFGHASGEVCVHPHMHVPTGWNSPITPPGTANVERSAEAVQVTAARRPSTNLGRPLHNPTSHRAHSPCGQRRGAPLR